jgi:hypothetical protein
MIVSSILPDKDKGIVIRSAILSQYPDEKESDRPEWVWSVLEAKDPMEVIATMDGDDLAGLFILVEQFRKHAEDLAKLAGSVSKSVHDDVIEHFTETGTQKVTRFGKTLYMARELWPKIVYDDILATMMDGEEREPTQKEIDEAKARARAEMMRLMEGDDSTCHLVGTTVNWQTLRSYILNDLDLDDDEMPIIPEHLERVLGTSETFKAKVVSS